MGHPEVPIQGGHLTCVEYIARRNAIWMSERQPVRSWAEQPFGFMISQSLRYHITFFGTRLTPLIIHLTDLHQDHNSSRHFRISIDGSAIPFQALVFLSRNYRITCRRNPEARTGSAARQR